MSKPLALAIDFKKFTSSVVKTGSFLFQNIYPDSKVILFHVIEQFFTPPAYLLPYINLEKARLEKELEELAQPLFKKGLRIEKVVLLGEFWSSFKNFIETINPEMVIIGYEPHLIKIPTAEKILERLETTFLVVKENPLKKLKRILCAFDFSDKAISALKKAFFIAEKAQGELFILHVINPLSLPDKTCNLQYLKEREKEVQEDWQNLLKDLELPSIKFSFEIVCGIRIDEILHKIQEKEIDLLIVGRRGRIVSLGLGSISKALIKTSSIPVLLVN